MRLAREGWPLVIGVAVVVILGAWFNLFLGAALLPVLIFTAWFFRDPDRYPAEGRDLLLAPADGRILVAGPRRVSIFMNVFDVHVCRAPIGGVVEEVTHTPGRFLAAYHETAAEQNERMSIVMADGTERLRFTLVAGLVARRIVCRVRPGQRLSRGERVGIILFGSRVDVHLPEGARTEIALGQRVVAGQTPIARWGPILAVPSLETAEGRAGRIPL